MLIRLIYNFVLVIICPFFLLSLYKTKKGKPEFGQRKLEHWGITPSISANTKPLWIHAVSVGEVIAAAPLIKAIKAAQPQQEIVVTTTTSTGAEQVAKLGDLVEHRYMPLDFSFAVKGFIRAIQPSQLLIMETELWPNTLRIVAKSNIDITVVNARLSDKSYRSYKRIQPLFNQIHPCISSILCQSKEDAARFASLGIPTSKLSVTGSIKFDITVPQHNAQTSPQFGERPVWIAASTHQGEDEIALRAHQALLKALPEALLIIVPRHPERFDSVNKLCSDYGMNVVRRTTDQPVSLSHHVYLADTMGELLDMLACAHICFMGGSLVGKKVGGHNMLESAAVGTPVISGPSYYNFFEIVDKMQRDNLITIVNNEQDLATEIKRYFTSNHPNSMISDRLRQFVATHSGAIKKSLEHIQLDKNSGLRK
ncbi:3-deoxy-D-manno-octulosonic-acid transferase [Vibrio sinaloensis DSM 21326]|uniref:3-deoxy-D-manno-octulosonic acid transferase n=1 Tax=Vibrio sinaloensis DSM 21326 TaxID=945550 RepID=E8M563_PHOS4|nr:lipid IV(A) 3-deoxy-D-manno-octulosonic acid transferase [Vibrio sinaloensis]EGA70914.1 3-deoxy-D-manno-octulosonic-acid transferase [Vibrio sinaloensis DSM 21326]